MRALIEGWHRLRSRWRRDALERRLDEEIRFHVEQETERHVRAGMSRADARRRALVAFGGTEQTRERVRDALRPRLVEALMSDLRHGARALRRAPGFTMVVTFTLALGIGATTAMFSVVNGVLLRPLPYPDQDRLVELVHEAPALGIDIMASPAMYFGYRDHSRTFDAIGLWDWDDSPVTITGDGEPETVASVAVTHEVLAVLGAEPALGRGFSERDDLPGSVATVIVSYGYWQRRFGGADPLGQTLVVNGVSREVIGVLPRWFQFFEYPADVFYPLQPVRATALFPAGDGRGIARLREGITLDQANADVARMIPILDAEFPGGSAAALQFGPKLRWLKDSVVGDLGNTLWLLMGTIGVLLVVACANVANLVLLRTEARRPEFAMRAALGAGWPAIARIVCLEGALLVFAGLVAGVAVAYISLPVLLSLGAADLPRIMTVGIDRSAWLAALGTGVLALVLFTVLPVVHLGRSGSRLGRALRDGSLAYTPASPRARHVLVVSQVALALVLLIGAGLMFRTFQAMGSVDPGFRDPDHVQTFQLTIPISSLGDAGDADDVVRERTIRMQREVLDRLAVVAGVESVALASSNDGLPLDGEGRMTTIDIEGRESVALLTPLREVQFVSPGFFETLHTPLVAGRRLEWADVERRGVVLVSENLARAEWGSAEAALHQRIRPTPTAPTGPWSAIVGVVGDVHHDGLSEPAPETVVFPALAFNTTASFVMRSERAGTPGLLDDLRAAIWSVNPALSPAHVRTLGDMYRRSMARTSVVLLLLAVTGGLALALGLVGTYGVVSYAAAQRRREIAVRLALGATLGAVRRMFVARALALVGLGVALGLGAAAGLTQVLASQLFGVTRLDAATHLAAATLLTAAAGLASYVSARRASALNAVDVLRGD